MLVKQFFQYCAGTTRVPESQLAGFDAPNRLFSAAIEAFGTQEHAMTPDEARVRTFLSEKGLKIFPFTKKERRGGKTPDFRVESCGAVAFYCEVKSIEDDPVRGLRDDPIFNRLASDIHMATKQLESENLKHAHPNVLAFVNHDDACGFADLLAVLTGKFFSESGRAHPIYAKFSEGRIKPDREKIDLFLWLDDFKPDRLLFSEGHSEHHCALCRLFQILPAAIRQVGAQQGAAADPIPSASLRALGG